jgi:hypothetical protein
MTRLRRPSAKMGALQLLRLFRHYRRGAGRIYIPASDEMAALAVFHSKWPTIAETAIARHPRADHTGDVVLVIGMFA